MTCTYLAKRLLELSSTKTGSYPHEFLCKTNCSACADYQPCTVREWNNLNLSVRNLDTLSTFKKAIRSSISMPIPRHYSFGPRKLNIILTGPRCNASFLNYDLCKVKMLSNASCNCCAPCENSHHFFFDCDKYIDNREMIFNSLNCLPSNINIDVNLLTNRSDLLTYQENITIFKHAFKYIKDSKRFTIV